MMTQLAIFDREDLVKAIDRECLSDPGNSAVIIGAHKVGKTHLLNHIKSRPIIGQESLYCKVDLDLLRVFAEGMALSDDVFLRFFLSALLEQINDWIERQSEEKEFWEARLRQAEQDLRTPAASEDALAKDASVANQVTVSALRQQLRELGGLIGVSGKIQALIDQTDALKSFKLMRVIDDLKRINKRIILIIDEFNLMIKEQGFSDNLFLFLRGANNQGKIIVLASSTVHPMDASLHPSVDKNERRSLFNHFKIQFLNPFNRDEAEKFLCWLPDMTPPLEPGEKEYLQGLGGGSPFFLMLARDRYLQYNRPLRDDQRREFERKDLAPALIGPFSQIWERCTQEDRSTLRRIAAGETLDEDACFKLEKEGYLVGGEAGRKIFSTLFADFIKQQAKSAQPEATSPATAPTAAATSSSDRMTKVKGAQTPQFEISIDVPYEVLPTALYIADFKCSDLVTFKIVNHSKTAWKFYLSCQILDYSQETSRLVTIPPGEASDIALPLTFHPEKISSLRHIISTQIVYRVELDLGGQRNLLSSDSKKVVLLPVNNFIFTRFNPVEKSYIDFTWLITAWVSRTGQSLREIISAARELEPALGMPVPAGEAGRQHIRSKVAAIYQALQKRQIQYHDQALVFHQEENDYVQRVQFPDETLEVNAANCLDCVVLFASLLSMCDLAPAILLTWGHALVGWKSSREPNAGWDFLETTTLSSATFDEACQVGSDKFAQVKDICKHGGGGHLEFDPKKGGFAILLDIQEIFRKRRILPLSIDNS